MSKEQLHACLEALKVDLNLQEKIYTATKKEAVEALG
ncbi:Nif11 family protein [Synechococcus sp. UW140]